jgi:hypothetical protein
VVPFDAQSKKRSGFKISDTDSPRRQDRKTIKKKSATKRGIYSVDFDAARKTRREQEQGDKQPLINGGSGSFDTNRK